MYEKNQLSIIRKYIMEVVVVTLVFAVMFLGRLYLTLDEQIKVYMVDDRLKLIEIINKNNALLTHIDYELTFLQPIK